MFKTNDLTHEIKVAITSNDYKQLYVLKDICDRLHSGIPSYKSFSVLPSDTLYEEMLSKLRESNGHSEILNARNMREDILPLTSTPHDRIPHIQRLPELWMGSIPKVNIINAFDDAILLPKFDGCSCGVKYVRNCGVFEPVKAVTRGQDDAFHKQNSDILAKFMTIAQPLTEALNTNEYTFNGLSYSKLSQICIRGEIVIKDKSVIQSAPAPYIAGKLNGGFEVWENAINNIEFVPFEIMSLTYHMEENDMTTKSDINYIPTQLEVLEFFTTLFLSPFSIVRMKLTDKSLNDVKNQFETFKKELTQPLDGIVYCNIDWTYPQTKDAKTSTNYNKYAWKPSSEATSVLRSVETVMGKDAKITFVLHYDPIKIGGKTYTQSNTFPIRLLKLKGIGIGSIVTVELCNDINPQIKEYEKDEEIKEYELPVNCPFCGQKLQHTIKKETYTIMCLNNSCNEIIVRKIDNFIHIHDIKGISDKKIRKLNEVNIENVNKLLIKSNVLVENLKKSTLHKFLGSINYGTNKQIEKITSKFEAYALLRDHVNALDDIALQMNDPFVYDVIDFIINHMLK